MKTAIPFSKTAALPPVCRAPTTWSVVGSEVIHDREEQVAEIWNARFKLGSVPIFYSPLPAAAGGR
ncbi:hypothetical protein LNP20_18805 [Klebsiella pneumoniae subsp. pneumoniae]|nr:hypothetical protein [Klebsiella pneumoniae subsp. pneumoniae]